MNYAERQKKKNDHRTVGIVSNRRYGQMESEPNPNTWSAREKAFKNTVLESKC